MNEDTNKKTKILLDLAEKLSGVETNRNFESRIMAGRVIPTPSFLLKPKDEVVKPKKDEEK